MVVAPWLRGMKGLGNINRVGAAVVMSPRVSLSDPNPYWYLCRTDSTAFSGLIAVQLWQQRDFPLERTLHCTDGGLLEARPQLPERPAVRRRKSEGAMRR